MRVEISKLQAKKIRSKLMNFAVAPGQYAHFINAGTDDVLTILEREYFQEELVEGISSFKYLEGDYGSGKTQFIHSLAEKARLNGIVSSVVNIGQECPFNSQSSIFNAIVASFIVPSTDESISEDLGIDVLFRYWIVNKLREVGCGIGQEVPDMVRRQLKQTFTKIWLGAPDAQMASALMGLGKRILDIECGAQNSSLDQELIAWVRGDKIRSRNLRECYSLHEPTRDETAFKRLKTVIEFLRTRLGFKGFFIAFDEGTRTNTFRRGSVKQKQAIENMLTMINENAEGQFGGVMFLYAATPDFRSDVIKNYPALFDRIGSVAFVPGRPMTPLITLESLNTEKVIREIGEKLLIVFAKADNIEWDQGVQSANIDALIQGIKNVEYLDKDEVSPRHFVYPYCRLLEEQKFEQKKISIKDAEVFVQTHVIPDLEDEE